MKIQIKKLKSKIKNLKSKIKYIPNLFNINLININLLKIFKNYFSSCFHHNFSNLFSKPS